MDNREWFKEAKFGMMIHFGLYSIPAGEWKGQRTNQIGEWLQAYYRIPNAEYGQLAKVFNPIFFDAEEWVKTAKNAGMQYMVVTSKHHDGFALFKSEWDNYNSVDGTPFGRDIIAEIGEACYKHGLKMGLYYSQEIDWHEPDGGGISRGYTHVSADGEFGEKGCSWTNDWDFPDNSKKDFTRCFEGKIKTQFKEILTKYGDLCLVWCDTPSDMKDGLFESPTTLNNTWGYKTFDNDWKSAERVIELKEHLNSRGINYLLNIGPDYLGRLPAPAVDILKAVGRHNK